MATVGQWTRELVRPAPLPLRPRWLHWLAWLGAIAAFVLLAVPLLGERLDFVGEKAIAWTDLGITVFFALEFFTRSGFRQHKWRYARWRLFDLFAMVPVLFIGGYAHVFVWLLWVVLLARLIRMVDRTFGDGFVKRNILALTEAFEEEVSDRVVVKIMSRIEGELAQAKFGEAAGQALALQKESILQRIYEEQRPETGALGKIAALTGVQTMMERLEARIFDAVVKVVGSTEMDALIRGIVSSSLERAKKEIGTRTWRTHLGLRGPAEP